MVDLESGEQTERIKTLWRTLIIQMINDALITSKRREKRKAKREALSWLSNTSPESDFAYVCDMAGLDPSYTAKLAQDIIAGRRPKIDLRKLHRRKGA